MNKAGCDVAEKLSARALRQYHANDEAYYQSVKLWKTPTKDCSTGAARSAWTTRVDQAWTEIKGWRPARTRWLTAASGRPDAGPDPSADDDRRPLASLRRPSPPGGSPRRSTGSPRAAVAPARAAAGLARRSSTSARSALCSSRRSGRSTPSRQVVTSSTLDNFQQIFDERGLPDGHPPDDRDRRRSSPSPTPPRVPVRVLHGPRRVAADARRSCSCRPAAALVELPRQGLRVAGDPRPGRDPQLVLGRSGSRGPATRTRRSGSSSRTSGCRS